MSSLPSQSKFPPSFLKTLRPRMCIGTWAWGAKADDGSKSDSKSGNAPPSSRGAIWDFSGGTDLDSNRKAFNCALNQYDVSFFDSAEVYNEGRSEEFLGQFAADLKDKEAAIATKFIPKPWIIFQSQLRDACEKSLQRLKTDKMSLYQVHGPAFSWFRSVECWAGGLVDVHKAGLTDEIGVSNYNSDQCARTIREIERLNAGSNPDTKPGERGYPRLTSNQIEYSLLHRLPEETGLISKCHEMGVEILAYSPLGMGRLTDQVYREGQECFDRKNKYRQFGGAKWEDVKPLLEELNRIAVAKNGKSSVTIEEVALAWVRAKGCIPIVGCKTETQVVANLNNSDMILSADEVERLDKVAVVGQTSFWQGSSE